MASDPGTLGQPTLGKQNALSSYLDWVKWKRDELKNLISKYKTEFPQQLAAYKASAYGALPEAQKNMWSGMYTNLDKRGLSDSASFLGGARKDLESWTAGEKSTIEDTALGMETSAQRVILDAVGKPDYGQLYDDWIKNDLSLQEYYDAEARRRSR